MNERGSCVKWSWDPNPNCWKWQTQCHLVVRVPEHKGKQVSLAWTAPSALPEACSSSPLSLVTSWLRIFAYVVPHTGDTVKQSWSIVQMQSSSALQCPHEWNSFSYESKRWNVRWNCISVTRQSRSQGRIRDGYLWISQFRCKLKSFPKFLHIFMLPERNKSHVSIVFTGI